MPDQNPAKPGDIPLKAALQSIPIFDNLTAEQLDWFVSKTTDERWQSGETVVHENDPADVMFILLEGEMRGRRGSTPDSPVFMVHAGQVTGMLPFSRLTVFPVAFYAFGPVRLARFHKDNFPEMMQRIPQLTPRLVNVLADRIREISRADQQREKLMALGKLSAGLAHELNNPASAAKRAAENLRQGMRELRAAHAKLDLVALSPEQRTALAEFEDCVIDKLTSSQPLDSLTQSDREEELIPWLEQRGIPNASRFAAGLVEADVERDELEQLFLKFEPKVLHDALTRIVAAVSAERLTREIEASTGRISELVKAVKEYSYMDQMPEQEIDIHKGIDNTLTMLKFRLKKGVKVTREYDKSLPRIFAHGSELNQIWTNLIDNAIDAMSGKGELKIRTSRELDSVLVEIIDNGPGMSEEVRAHIFEPFYTTKGIGDGTGLGLDTVYRIARSHHGEVRVDSKPGETNFQVRLPIQPPKGGTQ